MTTPKFRLALGNRGETVITMNERMRRILSQLVNERANEADATDRQGGTPKEDPTLLKAFAKSLSTQPRPKPAVV